AALLRLSGRLPAKNASDVINEWAFAGEQVAHGTPSGIDNAVSTRGGFLEYTKGSEARNLCTTNALRVLVTNTSVPRSTRELVAGVRNARDQHPTVVNLVLDAIHETAVSAVSLFENSSDGVEQRLQDLVRMNHGLLATLGVSHAALERIREITAHHNMASKLTGAGGGGCALTLVPSDASDETVEQVQCELRDAGFECYSTVVGGKGVAFTESVAAESVDKWIVRMLPLEQNDAVPADPNYTRMAPKTAATKRLNKEYLMMQKSPPEFITAKPLEKNVLEWHFIITGPPNTPYADGEYHGRLMFPKDYPFKPPSIQMLTPNGRFEVNKDICTSMSSFHPESWNPSWSVATIIMGLLSMMTGDERMTGGMNASDDERKRLAQASKAFNQSSVPFKNAFS
ncbi:Ubiquitin-conjugating enzyme E2 6, partial [Coemansia sp. RSA 454]